MVKNLFIIFVTGIILSLNAAFFIVNTSPFKIESLEELVEDNAILADEESRLFAAIENLYSSGDILPILNSNAYITYFSILIAIVCFLIFIHVSVEKLFFRKYYENPSFFDAIRRSVLVGICIAICSYVYINVYDWTIYILAILSTLLFEIFFYTFLRSRSYRFYYYLISNSPNIWVRDFRIKFRQNTQQID